MSEDDEERSLWKFLEALSIRIDNLEEVKKNDSRQNRRDFGASDSPQQTANALQNRVHTLEENVDLRYNFNQSSASSDKKIICPADSCNRSYTNTDRLHSHIRESPGVGHKTLLHMINQTHCFQCNKDFKRTKEFFHHETKFHKEGYNTRIQRFVQFFWEPSSKQRVLIRRISCLQRT